MDLSTLSAPVSNHVGFGAARRGIPDDFVVHVVFAIGFAVALSGDVVRYISTGGAAITAIGGRYYGDAARGRGVNAVSAAFQDNGFISPASLGRQ